MSKEVFEAIFEEISNVFKERFPEVHDKIMTYVNEFGFDIKHMNWYMFYLGYAHSHMDMVEDISEALTKTGIQND